MLSSVVLVSVQGAREKGRVSSLVTFATYNNRKLGINTILDVNFNESGVVAPIDSTNNFTTSNTIVRSSVESPVLGGSSFAVGNQTGANGFITFTSVASTYIPSTPNFTTSMWLKGSLPTTNNYHLLQIRNLLDNQHTATTYVTSAGVLTCVQYGITVTVSNASYLVSDGKWHNVLCTRNGNNLTLYIDGKLANEITNVSLPATVDYRRVTIGGDGIGVGVPNWSLTNGFIDNVQVYSDALTAMEIQQKYADGIIKHNLALDK